MSTDYKAALLLDVERDLFNRPLAEVAVALGHDPRLSRALTLVEGGYSNSALTLAKAARTAGLAPNHLNVVMSSSVGITFASFLRRYRLWKAAQLLASGSRLRAFHIAMECGFGSEDAFQRGFKAALGMTPRQFRKDLRWAAAGGQPRPRGLKV